MKARGHADKGRKILLCGISMLALVAALEGLSRLVERVRPDRMLAKLRIPPKQAGTFRIFVYGESTVAGLPIPEWGFVAQLEARLRALQPDKRLEVFNFGTPAWSSDCVRWMLTKTVRRDPDLLIVLIGHNEFLDRGGTGRLQRMMGESALQRVAARGMARLRSAPASDHSPSIMPGRIQAYDRNSALFRRKVQIYVNNLKQIADTAAKFHTPLVLMTAPSNVADWPPVHKNLSAPEHGAAYESLIAEAERLLLDGTPDQAVSQIEKLLAMRGPDPMLLYLLGKASARAGDYASARTRLLEAKDRDPVPWRVLSEFNEAIRARGRQEGVHLVDVEAIFQQHAEHGLVGFPLICDNCHPTPYGNAIIAAAAVEVLGRNRFFVEREASPSGPDEHLARFLARQSTSEEREGLERKYLLKNACYVMLTPFHNFSAARMYLERAMARDASDWRVWANLATVALLEHRMDEGKQQLAQAIRLRGAPMDLDDRGNIPCLKEALAQAGLRQDDFR